MKKLAVRTRSWLFRDVTSSIRELAKAGQVPKPAASKSANIERDAVTRSAISALIPDMVVKHGPFKGMKFPSNRTTRHTYFPKIFGSYERETHEIIERICETDYDTIVDVGSADGYFAIGLALRIPNARIFAFDPNERATRFLLQMAELNGVADRVQTGAYCDPSMLIDIPKGQRALVFCDCEGYEKELFNTEVINSLRRHDVFIETHDVFDIEITKLLRKNFSETHNLTSVSSIDDIQKAHTYDYSELSGYSLYDKKLLLAERRKAVMEWFFFESKEKGA